jgi:hypothetical protein
MNIPSRTPDPQHDGPLWGNYAKVFPKLLDLQPLETRLDEMVRCAGRDFCEYELRYLRKVKKHMLAGRSRRAKKYKRWLTENLEDWEECVSRLSHEDDCPFQK